MLSAGKLRDLVEIQTPNAAPDASGGPVSTWRRVALVYGWIRTLSGSTTLRSGDDLTIARASIRVRWGSVPGVLAGMRAVHGATVYEIRSVLPDTERRKHVDLVCEVVS